MGLHAAGPDTEVGEAPNEGVGRGLLKDLRNEWARRIGRHLDGLASVVRDFDGGFLGGRRQVAQDGVEHGADADVTVGRGHHHGRHDGVPDALVEAQLELLVAHLLAVEELHEHLVVSVGGRLQQLFAAQRDLRGQFVRDGRLKSLAVLVDPGRAVHEVHVALEAVGLSDGHLQRRRSWRRRPCAGRSTAAMGSAFARSAAGDEEYGRRVRLAAQADSRLGAGLDASRGVHGDECAIGGRETGDDLANEVRVARRVDERDVAAVAVEGVGGQRQRQLALLLFRLEVQAGGAIVHATHAADDPGLVEQVLRDGRLSGAGVTGHDDVAKSRDIDVGHAQTSRTG